MEKIINSNNKKLDLIKGIVEKIEIINNSKYLRNIYIKDDENRLYKTIINTRYTGDLKINDNIIIEGVAIKFLEYYKLISYKIYYNERDFLLCK
ncbi:hypothetical protein [Marinitoga litoralis]|uniref:hypothetical protein n=1 Tax=Marinitoga litoralis TaxID=570855 RepID=UPI001961D0CF|nr:hypothetical protein [Marinitoga litoralis]MBM7560390.1 hypothetical protein [Marinitoga litoralis]